LNHYSRYLDEVGRKGKKKRKRKKIRNLDFLNVEYTREVSRK